MKKWKFGAMAIFLLSAFFIQTSHGKVASTTLDNLVKISKLILVGQDLETSTFGGWHVAKFKTRRVLKGPADTGIIYYLATPTWTCDISESRPGENVLLFLEAIDPAEEVDRLDLHDKPPSTVSQQYVYRIAWSGRGRMPIRLINKVEYATVWVGDVRLPDNISTVSGAERKYSFIRSASLALLETEISRKALIK